MPLDAAALGLMARELSDTIHGSRIEKITQPERDEVVFVLRTPAGHQRLVISADPQNPRIHLTEMRKQSAPEAPLFCMLLRKHLGGGKITKIEQPGFERILRIYVSGRNELGDAVEKCLSAEFAGRHANIILLDADGKIIDAVNHTDLTSGRGILPGLLYTPPPPQDKADLSKIDVAQGTALLASLPPDTLAEKALVRLFGGISPLLARSIVKNTLGDGDAPIGNRSDALAAAVFSFSDSLVKGETTPVILRDKEGAPIDFAAYSPSIYEGIYDFFPAETLSDAMEQFFTERDAAVRMRRKSASLRRRIASLLDRLYKKIQIHTDTLAETETMEQYKVYGELICANLYRISENCESVTLENFYDNMTPIRIPMDKTKSPSQNAQSYFKKYRKLKTAEHIVAEELLKAKREAAYMEAVSEMTARVESEADLEEIRSELVSGGYIKEEKRSKRRKEAPSAPLSVSIDDFSVYIGRTGKQNEMVTFKLSRADDIWLHVKNMPGAHVLIRAEKREVPDHVILRAAEYAAHYSGAAASSGVAVDYTLVKNVWKPSGARPGMVLYKEQHTVFVTPRALQKN